MAQLAYKTIGTDGAAWPEWIRALKGKSGAYVIREHGCDGVIAYVGSSGGSLYDTITRHFQQWKRSKQWWRGLRGAGHDPGLTYRRGLCCVAVQLTAKGAHRKAEANLIERLKPRDNITERPDGREPDESETPF